MEKRQVRNRNGNNSPKTPAKRVDSEEDVDVKKQKSQNQAGRRRVQKNDQQSSGGESDSQERSSGPRGRGRRRGVGNRNRQRADRQTVDEDGNHTWRPCKIFLREGKCAYQDYCRYQHGEDDKREAPKEKPEDWTVPPVEFVRTFPAEHTKLVSGLVEEITKANNEENKDENAETKRTGPRFRGAALSVEGTTVKIVGRSIRALQAAWNYIWEQIIATGTTASAATSYYVVPKDDSFRFIDALRNANRGRNIRNRQPQVRGLRIRSSSPSTSSTESKIQSDKLFFAANNVSAEKQIEDLLKSNQGTFVIRTGLAFFKLEHDNFIEPEVKEEEKEEEEDVEEAEEGRRGRKRRNGRKPKIWTVDEVSNWQSNKDFHVSVDPYWNSPRPEQFSKVLKERDFSATSEQIIEIKALIGGSWKLFHYKWVPQEAPQETVESPETEEKSDDESSTGGKKRTAAKQKVYNGQWVATSNVVDSPASADKGTLVYALNPVTGTRLDKDLIYQVVGVSPSDSSKELLDYLNSKPDFNPFTINNEFTANSPVPIGEYFILRRNTLVSPDESYVVNETSIVRGTGISLRVKGTTVSFVFGKDAKPIDVITASRRYRDWIQILKLSDAPTKIEESPEQNAGGRGRKKGGKAKGGKASGNLAVEDLPNLSSLSAKDLKDLWLRSKTQTNVILKAYTASTQVRK
eukprot:TRINITY_DN597_c0_g2_i1.p1 TRINITY_DN597_c0_g2~~TRINITY_DN597_c0_g2_i1.p1  ORF type:complete len:689 (-),score=231.48 TRINITY_DN597_c0_g2_i1:44-2110(-)